MLHKALAPATPTRLHAQDLAQAHGRPRYLNYLKCPIYQNDTVQKEPEFSNSIFCPSRTLAPATDQKSLRFDLSGGPKERGRAPSPLPRAPATSVGAAVLYPARLAFLSRQQCSVQLEHLEKQGPGDSAPSVGIGCLRGAHKPSWTHKPVFQEQKASFILSQF